MQGSELVGMDFPASIQPLFVEELSDTLPTCICYHHPGVRKYFWSLAYLFDALVQVLDGDDGNDDSSSLELNKFVLSVEKCVSNGEAAQFLGQNIVHKMAGRRWFLESMIHDLKNKTIN